MLLKNKSFGFGAVICTAAFLLASGFHSSDPGQPTGEYVPIVVSTSSTGGSGSTPPPTYPPAAGEGRGHNKHSPPPSRTGIPSYTLALNKWTEFRVDWDTTGNPMPNKVKWHAALIELPPGGIFWQKTDLHANNDYIDLIRHPDVNDSTYHVGEIRLLKALDPERKQYILLTADVNDSFEDYEVNGVALYSK